MFELGSPARGRYCGHAGTRTTSSGPAALVLPAAYEPEIGTQAMLGASLSALFRGVIGMSICVGALPASSEACDPNAHICCAPYLYSCRESNDLR